MYFFAADFDDTLYFHDGRELRSQDLEAIRELQKAGNAFGLCTGRSISMYGGIAEKVKGKVDFDFTVFSNGTCITDRDGRIIKETFLPEALVKDLLKNWSHIPMVIHHQSGIYSPIEWPYEIEDLLPYKEHEDKIELDRIYEISFDHTIDGTQEVLDDLADYPGIQLAANSKFTDLFSKEASKGKGLLWLAAYNGIAPEQTAAIGDSFNDLSMIEDAGMGFTFPSSPQEVQQAADAVCDGISEAAAILNEKEQGK